MIDTKKLRELAQAATPGPWMVKTEKVMSIGTAYEHRVTQVQEAVGLHTCAHGICQVFQWHERSTDVDFIAAANPQTVLALLDEIERLRNVFAAARDWRFQVARRTFEPSLALEAAVDAALIQTPFDTITDQLRARYEFEHARFSVANEEREALRSQLAAMTKARDEACRLAMEYPKFHAQIEELMKVGGQ